MNEKDIYGLWSKKDQAWWMLTSGVVFWTEFVCVALAQQEMLDRHYAIKEGWKLAIMGPNGRPLGE